MIGPLDDLTIFVWRNPELGANVQVRPDGRITTPLITDMPAVGKDLLERRTRQQAALRPRVTRTDADIVGIEQAAKLRMKRLVARDRLGEHEGFEKPAGVGEMPLHRTRIGHRLQRAILGGKRFYKAQGLRAHRREALRESGIRGNGVMQLGGSHIDPCRVLFGTTRGSVVLPPRPSADAPALHIPRCATTTPCRPPCCRTRWPAPAH